MSSLRCKEKLRCAAQNDQGLILQIDSLGVMSFSFHEGRKGPRLLLHVIGVHQIS